MDPLAGRPFARMNGLGNEIVTLDLRGTDIAVTPHSGAAPLVDEALRLTRLLHELMPDEPSVLDYNLEFKQPACAACAPAA